MFVTLKSNAFKYLKNLISDAATTWINIKSLQRIPVYCIYCNKLIDYAVSLSRKLDMTLKVLKYIGSPKVINLQVRDL